MAKLIFCPSCREIKDNSLFYRHKARSTGYNSRCKKCHIKKVQGSYTKEEIKVKNKKNNLKKKYNLTLEVYEQMKIDQDYCCFICSERVELVVDHNHTTGEVRKLLCRNCNSGISMFRENPEFLQRAKEYVSSQN